MFPDILPAAVPSVTLVESDDDGSRPPECATRGRRAWKSSSSSAGAAPSAWAINTCAAMNLIMPINQNVPTCAASGTNNGCRPNPALPTTTSTRRSASRTITACMSRSSSGRRLGPLSRVVHVSKSMNNVGENFFSSPIDPIDLSKDWGRSDDDQRHRLVVSGARRDLPVALSAEQQRCSHTRRCRSTSPPASRRFRARPARPIVDGEFIERNAGIGSDFFTLSARLSRSVQNSPASNSKASPKSFNLTNRRNDLTRNANFGSGRIRQARRDVRTDYRRRRTEDVSIRAATEVLMRRKWLRRCL